MCCTSLEKDKKGSASGEAVGRESHSVSSEKMSKTRLLRVWISEEIQLALEAIGYHQRILAF